MRLVAAGALLSMLPTVMAGQKPAQGLESTEPLGWLMLAAGALLVFGRRWMARRAAPAAVLAPGAAVSPGRAISEAVLARMSAPHDPDVAIAGPRRFDAGVLRRLDAHRFCAVIEALFERRGHQVRRESHARSTFPDLILDPKGRCSQASGIVRCLPAAGRPLDAARIREFAELLRARGLRQGHFVTSALLTPEAIALARTHGIELLDMDRLLRIFARLPSADREALVAVALTETDPLADADPLAEADAPGSDRISENDSKHDGARRLSAGDRALPGRDPFPIVPRRVRGHRPVRAASAGNTVAAQLPGYLNAFRAAANSAAKSASPEPSTTKLVA